LHRLRDDETWRRERPAVRSVRLAPAPGSQSDLAALAARYATAVDATRLHALADGLGLSAESLTRLRIGWAAEHRAWAFPMVDAAGKVGGVRLRLADGRKLAVRGGHDGLFIPTELPEAVPCNDGRLLVAEGPTDTAALLDLGFAAVGRPSCAGGIPLIVELARRAQPGEVVIVADADAPGQRGAANLAAVLVAYVPAVRIVTPPNGIKDARVWKRRGATHHGIQAAIDTAPVCRLKVRVEIKGR
jgi:5S rRNA maturation endonuclease (ribonuclease M5)